MDGGGLYKKVRGSESLGGVNNGELMSGTGVGACRNPDTMSTSRNPGADQNDSDLDTRTSPTALEIESPQNPGSKGRRGPARKIR
jgi:hypothetical protein